MIKAGNESLRIAHRDCRGTAWVLATFYLVGAFISGSLGVGAWITWPNVDNGQLIAIIGTGAVTVVLCALTVVYFGIAAWLRYRP